MQSQVAQISPRLSQQGLPVYSRGSGCRVRLARNPDCAQRT